MWISQKNFDKERRICFKDGEDRVNAELIKNNENLWKSYNKLDKERNELQKKYNDLVKNLREQSKADMVFEALKIIIEGIKPEVSKEHLTGYYQQMMAQQQSIHSYPHVGLGNMLGNLFLSNT
ncbi:MAG: hypothetical protein WC197_07990 [Candidatus Gastranaerophilaceae bacterium]|jgi:TATA-box binding protein (TBP) (component of TFIID and TFIIIB)